VVRHTPRRGPYLNRHTQCNPIDALHIQPYQEALRLASKEFNVALLNFSITSNHTHQNAIEAEECGISDIDAKS
jgi:hypothetical protein